jgi:hypothetical protein
MIGFHEGLRVRVVRPEEIRQFDPGNRSFLNANSEAELERIRSFVTQEHLGKEARI